MDRLSTLFRPFDLSTKLVGRTDLTVMLDNLSFTTLEPLDHGVGRYIFNDMFDLRDLSTRWARYRISTHLKDLLVDHLTS